MILLISTMLGLLPVAPRRTLIVDPSLPEWLPEVTIKNIRVGQSRVALKFSRDTSSHTHVEILEAANLCILQLPPRNCANSEGTDRIAAALCAAVDSAGAITLARAAS